MNKVKYFEHNNIGRDFVIGDLHGCFEEFTDFIKKIGVDKIKDRIFSVGDLVDRGPDSVSCLELLYEPWFHAVRGNHEQMMIDSLIGDGKSLEHWICNGGAWYSEVDLSLLKELAVKANELPYVIVIGKDSEIRYNIVHAELYKASDEALVADEDIDEWFFQEYQEENMIWGRTIAGNKQPFEEKKIENPGLSMTFVGHTPITKPFKCLNHVFIDTAAVYKHHSGTSNTKLTIVELGEVNKMYSYNMDTLEVTEVVGVV